MDSNIVFAVLMKCPTMLVWNDEGKICDWADNVSCEVSDEVSGEDSGSISSESEESLEVDE